MPAEGDDDRLVLGRQHRRPRLSWSCRSIGDQGSLLPLRYGLLIDAVAPRELPQALLTMLYRSTHCLCRAGAPMQNLSHSASFHSSEKTAPSKSGIKHLERASAEPTKSRHPRAVCSPVAGGAMPPAKRPELDS